jgi:hypothetical protein
LYKISLDERSSSLLNKGPGPLQRGDNHTFKKISSPEPLDQFYPVLAQIFLRGRKFIFIQTKGIALLEGEIITKK